MLANYNIQSSTWPKNNHNEFTKQINSNLPKSTLTRYPGGGPLVLFKIDLVTAWQKLCVFITNAFRIKNYCPHLSVSLYAPLIFSVSPFKGYFGM